MAGERFYLLVFTHMSSFIVGHNYALGKTASQSSTYDDRDDLKAGIAVDGETTLGLLSHTEFTSNQWWKVDLGKVIIFQYARIYPRATDTCGPGSNMPCGKLVSTAGSNCVGNYISAVSKLF